MKHVTISLQKNNGKKKESNKLDALLSLILKKLDMKREGQDSTYFRN